jgi:tetratricopeptide (TPR) repeat protein
MRILSLIILTFLGNSAFAECPFTDRTAENSIRTYQQCIEDGLAPSADIKAALAPATEDKASFRSAVETFTTDIESTDSPDASLYLQRGLAHLALAKKRQALRNFETYTSQAPNHIVGHFYRGVALLEQRKYRDAIGALETAFSMNSGSPQNAQVHFTKAKAELASRNRKAAIVTLGNAISSDPQFAPANFERAQLREKEDLKAQAIEDYSRYITLRPDRAEAYYNRGLIYQDLHQDHLAIKDFNKALEFNPRYIQPGARKGLAYLLPVVPVLLVLMAG